MTPPPAVATSASAGSARDVASLRLVGWLAASWALLFVIGVLSLHGGDAIAAGNHVAFDRAVFTAANVSAAAGFAQQFARPDDFSAVVRAVFVLQTLSGVLLFLAGGGVLLARLLDRPYGDGRITATTLAMIAAAGVLGVFARHGDDTVGAGLSRGVGALACGGLSFGDDPRPGTLGFSLILVPLSVLGSWGVVVACDGVDFFRKRVPPSNHAVRVVVLTAVIYLVGVATLVMTLRPPRGPLATTLVQADAVLWAAHAYGLPVKFASAWPKSTLWTVLGLIVVGTGTAGTAANLGLAWLVTMPRRLSRAIGQGLILQCMLLSATVLALAACAPQLRTEPRLLLAVAAAGGVGLSHEPLTLTGVGLVALAGCVMAAKALPLGVLALAVHDRRTAAAGILAGDVPSSDVSTTDAKEPN